MNGGSPATIVILLAYLVIFFRFDLMNPSDEVLFMAGAVEPVHVATGEGWRLVSAQFVHIGFMHLLFNGYFLWMLGPVLERELGTVRYVMLYVLGGVAGFAACSITYPAGGLVAGGSCSLFGFTGAILAMVLRYGRSAADFVRHPAARSMLGLVVANIVIGFLLPFISQTGHIGGLIGGFLVTFFLFKLPEAGRVARWRPAYQIAACGIFLVATSALALVPVHRTWFTARDLWLHAEEMSEARVDALRGALEARGLSDVAVQWLARTGRYRQQVLWDLSQFELASIYRGLREELVAVAGVNRRNLLMVQNTIRQIDVGDRSIDDVRMPDDIWRED